LGSRFCRGPEKSERSTDEVSVTSKNRKLAWKLAQLLFLQVVLVLLGSPIAQADAMRSTVVVVLNGTGYQLSLESKHLNPGKWTPGWEPPTTIENGVTAQWRCESAGLLRMTGCEGEAVYQIEGVRGPVRIYWDNPFIGPNKYDISAPPGFSAAKVAGGKGNRTFVQFYVGLPGQSPPCNTAWIISMLRTTPNSELTDFQKRSALFSTPFKEAGFSGWVTTGCSAEGSGKLVRNAAKSSDGFTTIDVEISRLNVASVLAPSGRFIRLEVRPEVPLPLDLNLTKDSQIAFSGPVLIDMDLQDGGLLVFGTSGVTAGWLEIHPTSMSPVPR
jgi:hypothetical protein